MVLNPDPPKCYARIQRKPEGRCRSCVVGISAELVENLDNSAKTLNFYLKVAIEHKKVHHRKCWQQRLVARFCDMVTRTALLEFFSWMLCELTVPVLLLVLQTA